MTNLTGVLEEEDVLYIYYGTADERIAVASVSICDPLNKLLSYAPSEEEQ